MRYVLEISEEQAVITKIALEEYFRLRMNQTGDFADSICFEGYERTDEDFNERIDSRDMFRLEFGKLLNKFHPVVEGGKFREKTIEMRRAMDIWQVIRHKLWIDRHGDEDSWCVDSREPMCMSGESLPRMEGVEE